MDGQVASASLGGMTFPRGLLGTLDPAVAEHVVSAAGDVAMIIDREGIIRDLALSNDDMARDGATAWLDRPWLDTVTIESKPKVDEMLRDAVSSGRTRWREVNQVTPGNASLMVRYVAVDAGRDGRVIAIGRDGRAATNLQQRLIEAQQSLERDYSRLRDAEGRYRLLFRMSAEAILVVNVSNNRIIEANPAAERMLADGRPALTGGNFVNIFDPQSRDEAASLLLVERSTSRSKPSEAQLFGRGRLFRVSASLFRQGRISHCLLRLVPNDQAASGASSDADLRAVLERIPDAFLVADAAMTIVTANASGLDLLRVGTLEQVVGQPLGRFLGRAGLDRNLLLDTLREHGAVRNFRTILRNAYDEPEDVEVSGVAAPDRDETVFGLTIRNVERRMGERPSGAPALRRSVEQLTQLVGRMTLKELVRETTDLVERLCIEAALELTNDNRASAADVLGLSRQSLYSKLHRFGLGNLAAGDT